MFGIKEAPPKKRTALEIVQDFDAAVKKMVSDTCDAGIDLNAIYQGLPDYVGAFRQTVGRMIANENIRRAMAAGQDRL